MVGTLSRVVVGTFTRVMIVTLTRVMVSTLTRVMIVFFFFFFKWANPASFSFIFGLFKQTA